MSKYLILIIFIFSLLGTNIKTSGQSSYLDYHKEIITCEEFITENKIHIAIAHFDSLFSHYNFVFLRDCKLAATISAFEQDKKSVSRFMRLGISNGWTLKSIKKNKLFRDFYHEPQWIEIQSEYDSLHKEYLKRLDASLRQQIHEMYKKDQKKAISALFRIGQKSKDNYAENKFAPHSEKQLARLNEVISQYGYPGEQLIGNNWWVSVILSHHNSISVNYNSKNTLYTRLKPKLINAIKKGEMSPYTLATIEDWRTASLNGHKLTSYGFLGEIPDDSVLEIVNKNRKKIGIRSIELRNNLIDIEKRTGLDLYLPTDWQKGKITIADSL